MPAAISIYDWGEEVCKLKTQKAWKASLKDKIKKMDRAEFDLFLASVVMEAAKKHVVSGTTAQVMFHVEPEEGEGEACVTCSA